MALPDVDSSVGHSFGLEFDGVVIEQIVEVSGPKIDAAQRAEAPSPPEAGAPPGCGAGLPPRPLTAHRE
jgi:hypothetical protein